MFCKLKWFWAIRLYIGDYGYKNVLGSFFLEEVICINRRISRLFEFICGMYIKKRFFINNGWREFFMKFVISKGLGDLCFIVFFWVYFNLLCVG